MLPPSSLLGASEMEMEISEYPRLVAVDSVWHRCRVDPIDC